jgi:hypothetical protein
MHACTVGNMPISIFESCQVPVSVRPFDANWHCTESMIEERALRVLVGPFPLQKRSNFRPNWYVRMVPTSDLRLQSLYRYINQETE